MSIRWVIVGVLCVNGLCIASWGILPTPLAINATRVVTGLCFGAVTAARVLVVARLLPVELQATGQTLLQAATFGLGTCLGAVLAGAIYGALGPMAFFTAAGALTIGGGVGAWVVLYGPVGAPTQAVERVGLAVG